MASAVSLKDSPRSSGIIEARIAENRPLAHNQWSIWIKAENELESFLPGAFCMLSLPDFVDPLTPRPFAIAERKNGMYNFIYKSIGKFTKLLTKMPNGSRINLLGPLGRGFEDEFLRSKKITFVAGGVGYATVLPAIERIAELNGKPSQVFYGVRTEIEIIRRGKTTPLYCSDDGSIGLSGRVTELLKINKPIIEATEAFLVCGPTPMMKAVYEILPPEKSYYFLEETMGCGVGICIGCVVPIQRESGEVTRVRSCLEGSVFRGDVLKPWKDGQWAS